jgi:hypothetical protein
MDIAVYPCCGWLRSSTAEHSEEKFEAPKDDGQRNCIASWPRTPHHTENDRNFGILKMFFLLGSSLAYR